MSNQLVRVLYKDVLRSLKQWQKELTRGKGSIRLNVELEPFRQYLHEQPITNTNLSDLTDIVRKYVVVTLKSDGSVLMSLCRGFRGELQKLGSQANSDSLEPIAEENVRNHYHHKEHCTKCNAE